MNCTADILKLLPPPAPPRRIIDDPVWENVRRQIGVVPPPDYREFCRHYGSCFLGTENDPYWMVLRTPFDKGGCSNYGSIVGGFKFQVEHLMSLRKAFPSECPYPILPEEGGVFPFAHDSCGFEYYWLTRGDPAEWPLVISPDGPLECLDMSFSDFILRLISGRYPHPGYKQTLGPFKRVRFAWTPMKVEGN